MNMLWPRLHPYVFALVLLAVGSLFACHRSREPEELPVVRIGMVVPDDGVLYDKVGQPGVKAARLAVKQVNDRGGLKVGEQRYRVALVIEEDRDRPEVAVQVARKLINVQGVVALVGPFLSRNALAVATVAESLQTPMISPTASHPKLTANRRFVFRTTLGDRQQAQLLVRFVEEELGARKAAALFDIASAYNRSFAESFSELFEAAGGEMVAFESYTTGSRDFRRQLQRIQQVAPEILLLPNYVDDVQLQVWQARELGIEATLVGGDTWNMKAYAADENFEGSYCAIVWHIDLVQGEAEVFIGAFNELYGQPPGSIAALTYDAFGLLFEAIEKQGSFAGPALRDGLAQIEGYQGVTGTFSFHGSGEPLKEGMIVSILDGQEVVQRKFGWERPGFQE
jgi:branched-chain amino acid transport system substrate-binding protein